MGAYKDSCTRQDLDGLSPHKGLSIPGGLSRGWRDEGQNKGDPGLGQHDNSPEKPLAVCVGSVGIQDWQIRGRDSPLGLAELQTAVHQERGEEKHQREGFTFPCVFNCLNFN